MFKHLEWDTKEKHLQRWSKSCKYVNGGCADFTFHVSFLSNKLLLRTGLTQSCPLMFFFRIHHTADNRKMITCYFVQYLVPGINQVLFKMSRSQ